MDDRRHFLTAAAAFAAGATLVDGASADAATLPVTILSGTGAPKVRLGRVGDFYIDHRHHRIYGPKRAHGWGKASSLIGPRGAKGAKGARGAAGYSVLHGASAPAKALGEDNDFYIDTATTQLYGPKTGGVWGSPASLSGQALAGAIDGDSTTIQLRRASAGAAAAANPRLAAAEIGIEIDTGRFKIGDGATAWNALAYATDLSRLPAAVQQLAAALSAGQLPIAASGGDGLDLLSASNALALLPAMNALANADATGADVLLLGDSQTEGAYISAMADVAGHRLAAKLRDEHSARPRGGCGVLLPLPGPVGWSNPIVPVGSGATPAANRSYGLAQRAVNLSAATQQEQVTLPVAATSVDIEWAAASGGNSDVLSVAVDGAAATTFTGAGGQATNRTHIPFGTRGEHTLILGASEGSLTLCGVYVHDGDETAGLRVHVAGHSGLSTVDLAGAGANAPGQPRAQLAQSYAFLAPALAIIQLGTNDYLENIAPSVFATALSQLIADIKGASPATCFLLVVPWQPEYLGGGNPAAPWSDYVAATRIVAAGRPDSAVLDLGRRIYPGSGPDPLGLFQSGVGSGVHLSDAGEGVVANALAATLAATAGTGPPSYRTDSQWTALPALENGWSTSDAAYRITRDGEVVLRGSLHPGTTSAGTPLCTFPAGLRPSARVVIPTATASGAGVADALIAIGADGAVTLEAANATDPSALYLAPVRWLAEQ